MVHLGRLGGHLGPSWSPLGGQFWDLLGRPGTILEAFWALLGPSWEPLVPFWAVGRPKRSKCQNPSKTYGKSMIWASSGPPGGPLGGLLGCLGGLLGASWAVLGHLEAILGRLGCILGRLGGILGPS